MGSLYFSLSISYNQSLFLITQSLDAISGEGDSDFSDSKRLLWSRKCPRVIRVSHIHPPLWLNNGNTPRVHLCSSFLKSRELIVWWGRGGQHPRHTKLCHRERLPALLVRQTAGESKAKIRGEGRLSFCCKWQFFVFVFCSWQLSSHLGLSSKTCRNSASGWVGW